MKIEDSRNIVVGRGSAVINDHQGEQSGRLPLNTGIERSSTRITPESMGHLMDRGRQYFDGVG